MDTARPLTDRLVSEKKGKASGGIHSLLQVEMAYNSNHMEGSELTHGQTMYIYETQTVVGDGASVDDIVEAVNHFRCLDLATDRCDEPLGEGLVREIRRTLRAGTFPSRADYAAVGDHERLPNLVGDVATAPPSEVAERMGTLIGGYLQGDGCQTLDDLLDFHVRLESIHPFCGGNGRVGRLALFEECLRNDIVPFVTGDKRKALCLRGIRERGRPGGERGYLRDTCLAMQDRLRDRMDYLQIPYVVTPGRTAL